MTTLDRTAYPHLNKPLTDSELAARYTLDDRELAFVEQHTRGDRGPLVLAILLKTRQQLGYFVPLTQVPLPVTTCIAKQLDIAVNVSVDPLHERKSQYRYRSACREFLSSTVFSPEERERVIASVNKAAHTMSDPADLINVAIETLSDANVELPAFSTLERLVGHQRQRVHLALYKKTTESLTPTQRQSLDELLQIPSGDQITGFARLKQTPGPATLNHFRAWADRLTLLDSWLDPTPFLQDVTYTKLRQFAAEATAYAIGDMRGIRHAPKRYTLLLALLHQTRRRTRDEVVDMFLRRMKRVVRQAQENLRSLQEKHQEIEENLISVLGQVLGYSSENDTDEALGQHVRQTLSSQGGFDVLSSQVKAVSAYHQNNYLPFLWSIHASNRATIFRALQLIELKPSTQDSSLLTALKCVCQYRSSRKADVPAEIDLCFASQRWRSFVTNKHINTPTFDRRALEVCVFIHLAESLQNGDIYVEGSEAYTDYRAQLLPWSECQNRLAEYCQALDLPNTGVELVAHLRAQLTRVAHQTDQQFPGDGEFTLDPDGVPHVKRLPIRQSPEGLDDFKKIIRERMPNRHLLDILRNVQHWSHYTKHFVPR